MATKAKYLDDPVFAEEPTGPGIIDGRGERGRDPSPTQIRRRAMAIRKARPRAPTGDVKRFEMPMVSVPEWFDER